MRKITVAGNWKMNLNLDEALSLIRAINEGLETPDMLDKVLIFPSFPFLAPLKDEVSHDLIQLGSQNIASKQSGAYTGEVAASMIRSMGFNYTLVGHSERRQFFGEKDDVLRNKINMALENALSPVFCCGEMLEERKENRQKGVIESQLQNSLFHLGQDDLKNVIIAYEPVWAIGTGETATAEQAEEMHAHIRNLLHEKYGSEIADSTPILYGGSCNAGNAAELFSCENVDGGLIGGASLKAEEFLSIISQLDG